MIFPQFIRLLLFVFGGLLLLFQGLLMLLPELVRTQDLFWLTQFIFISLCVIGFFIAKRLIRSKNINTFSQLIMLFTLNKLIVSAVVIIVYGVLKKPTGFSFLIPFFISYLTYTAFSVYFLTKIGKEK